LVFDLGVVLGLASQPFIVGSGCFAPRVMLVAFPPKPAPIKIKCSIAPAHAHIPSLGHSLPHFPCTPHALPLAALRLSRTHSYTPTLPHFPTATRTPAVSQMSKDDGPFLPLPHTSYGSGSRGFDPIPFPASTAGHSSWGLSPSTYLGSGVSKGHSMP
jgi:hypothetical protein